MSEKKFQFATVIPKHDLGLRGFLEKEPTEPPGRPMPKALSIRVVFEYGGWTCVEYTYATIRHVL